MNGNASLVHNIEIPEPSNVESLDLSILGRGHLFKKLLTFYVSLLILLIVVAQTSVSVLVVTDTLNLTTVTIEPIRTDGYAMFHFLLICESLCWLLTASLDRVIHLLAARHRTQGYVAFYSRTKFLRRLPCYTVSTGCAACVMLSGVLGWTRPWPVYLKPEYFMLGISALQFTVIFPAVLLYTLDVLRFNRSRDLPDMEKYLGCSDGVHIQQVGTNRSKQELEETIDKQGEIIQSLQHHNQVLARRIMSLHRQIKA